MLSLFVCKETKFKRITGLVLEPRFLTLKTKLAVHPLPNPQSQFENTACEGKFENDCQMGNEQN